MPLLAKRAANAGGNGIFLKVLKSLFSLLSPRRFKWGTPVSQMSRAVTRDLCYVSGSLGFSQMANANANANADGKG